MFPHDRWLIKIYREWQTATITIEEQIAALEEEEYNESQEDKQE